MMPGSKNIRNADKKTFIFYFQTFKIERLFFYPKRKEHLKHEKEIKAIAYRYAYPCNRIYRLTCFNGSCVWYAILDGRRGKGRICKRS